MNTLTKQRTSYGLWLFLAIAVFLAVSPLFLSSFSVFLLTRILFLGLTAMSLYVLMGLGGMLSFAQMGFYGITAYAIGITTTKFGWTFGAAIPFGLVAVLLVAAVFALIAIRTNGNYFLMITLAFGQMLYLAAQQWVELTGGFSGTTAIPVWGFLTDRKNMFYMVFVVVLLCYLFLKRLTRSAFGIALQGVRDNPQKMESLGFNTQLIRYVAMLVSALMAGLSGMRTLVPLLSTADADRRQGETKRERTLGHGRGVRSPQYTGHDVPKPSASLACASACSRLWR